MSISIRKRIKQIFLKTCHGVLTAVKRQNIFRFCFCGKSVALYLYLVFLPLQSFCSLAYKGCGILGPLRFDQVTKVSKLRNSLPDFRTEYLSFFVSLADYLSVLIKLGFQFFLMWEFFCYLKNKKQTRFSYVFICVSGFFISFYFVLRQCCG
jgi:hypothetical protein